MKAIVTDASAISTLRPASILGYLRYKGWMQFSEVRGKFSVWHNAQHPDAEIVVPSSKSGADFLSRAAAMLSELETVEQRSQLDILRDLLNSGFDVVRLSLSSPSTHDGSVLVSEGVKLFSEARELLLSAACATVRPSPVFHSRKPQQAVEYLQTARLGQTEHGSFVVTMLSPVAPQLTAYGDTDLFPPEPFSRQVIRTLATSIHLTVHAAEQAATTVDSGFDAFQNAVNGGVSANLCEALAGLFQIGDPTSVSASVAWAQSRPFPEADVPSHTVITNDVVPMIEEAARVFRAKDSLPDYKVIGPVVKLERADGALTGQATIFAPIENTMRKVTVSLSEDDYIKATDAHKNYRSVKVVGNVKKEGRSYQVINPLGFDYAPDDEPDETMSD